MVSIRRTILVLISIGIILNLCMEFLHKYQSGTLTLEWVGSFLFFIIILFLLTYKVIFRDEEWNDIQEHFFWSLTASRMNAILMNPFIQVFFIAVNTFILFLYRPPYLEKLPNQIFYLVTLIAYVLSALLYKRRINRGEDEGYTFVMLFFSSMFLVALDIAILIDDVKSALAYLIELMR